LHWYEGQRHWFETLEIFVDLGYQGIDKDFVIQKLNIPFKRDLANPKVIQTLN